MRTERWKYVFRRGGGGRSRGVLGASVACLARFEDVSLSQLVAESCPAAIIAVFTACRHRTRRPWPSSPPPL
eukprot:2335920-Prymnesium_polylepis.1